VSSTNDTATERRNTEATSIDEQPHEKRVLDSILSSLNPDPQTWSWPDIDVVYTWVNGSDIVWRSNKKRHHDLYVKKMTGQEPDDSDAEEEDDDQANGDKRYRERDELLYSLRSIDKYAPFVRKIFIVVADGQQPHWLKEYHPKIQLVPHSQIFENPDQNLPTFSSVAIESNLINIPGLADFFWYFNDDTFLGSMVTPEDLLVSKFTGQQRVFEEPWSYPGGDQCAPECSNSMLGDGTCDPACRTASCGWDLGDCGSHDSVSRDEEETHESQQTGSGGPGDFYSTLAYVNGVFNRAGFKPPREGRRIIRHVPHLVNKRMFQDLKARFYEEYKQTEEHKFRDPEDMQFAFAYNHYLSTVKMYAPSKKYAWKAAFDSLDSANEGKWFLYNNNEDGISDSVELEKARKILETDAFARVRQCATDLFEHGQQNRTPQELPLSASDILQCDQAMDDLIDKHNLRLPFEAIVPGDGNESLFISLKDNHIHKLVTFWNLWRISRTTAKFITTNDDLSQYSPMIEEAYHSVMTCRLPDPSPFELKPSPSVSVAF